MRGSAPRHESRGSGFTATKTIRAAVDLLAVAGSVVELRCLAGRRTYNGYFEDFDQLARAAAAKSGHVSGVYFTLNEIKPELLARRRNRLDEVGNDQATKDSEVVRRRFFPLDFDPVRPKGISATQAEHQLALDRGRQVRDWLRGLGWPEPIFADSGNGAHLLYRIDLPNDDAARELVSRCLQAVALRFSDEKAVVDASVFNASRIWKLYGTIAAKGDATPERPHRLAKILETPDDFATVDRALLEALSAQLPKAEREPGQGATRFDVETWLSKHGIEVVTKGSWNGGQKWVLRVCPWNPEHVDRSACVVQFQNGALAASCRHTSCADKRWRDLRDLHEPPRSTSGPTVSSSIAAAPTTPAPPTAADPLAYHGIAGEIVAKIEPHTEADPVAILVQLLIGFGNLVGRTAHFVVEADRHFMNLFAAIVGSTSKGRKGTSWGRVRHVYEPVDPDWTKSRVMTGLSSGEGLIWQVRDPIVKHDPIKHKGHITGYQEVIADQGIKDKRIMVLESEYANTLRVIGREGNNLSPIIRLAWDTGKLSTLTKHSPAVATDAHVSIIGHITRQELLRHLDSTEAANGFANRFLWISVRRSKSLPEGGRLHEEDLESINRRLVAAVEFARNTGRMVRDEEAREAWRTVYPALSEGHPGLFGAVISRAEAQVTRLSCLYALLDCSRAVQVEHLRAAIALWEYAEASARYIFGDALGDPVADQILKALRRNPGGLTRTQIRDLFDRNLGAAQIGRALGVLLEQGLVHFVEEETNGRPAERWLARDATTSIRPKTDPSEGDA